jgi:hypothetical protein
MRLHTRAELQGWLPGLVNDRHLNGTRQIAGGIGDAGAAVRVQILTIGELAHLPSLAMTGGLFAPTGRRIEQTSPPLFAGATGRGAWGGSLAVESEYAFLPWFMRIEAGITTFLRFRRSDTGQRQQYGRLVRAALSAGREVFSTNLVAAVSAQAEWQARLALDDVSVNSSEVRLFALGVSLSWRATPHWTTVAVLTNSVWPDGFGRNQDARVDFTVGLRYGYF